MDGTVQTTEKELKGKVVYIPEIDKTLTKDGYSADAKVTGDKFDALAETLKNIQISGGASADAVSYTDTDDRLGGAETVQEAIDSVVEGIMHLANSFMSTETGVEVNGRLDVKAYDNGYGSVNKNHSETADYGTQLVDVDKNGNTAHLDISALYDSLNFTGLDNTPRQLLHEGNKKFDSYTGNGSATKRTIGTHGIGKLLLVYSSTSLCYVTPKGANVVTLETGEWSWIDSAKVFYVDGTLTLATTNEAFNTNGETYYYQVI